MKAKLPTDDAVISEYSRRSLLQELDEAVSAEGRDPLHPTLEDVSALDQFHTGGKTAVFDLADEVGLQAGQQVLDVGGGVGGPARLIAHRYGVNVTVLDLTPTFIEAGAELTRRVGLSEQVSHRLGSALEMPFEDASFDVIWTQHSTMNIPNKRVLYRECARVVRPGGRLAVHEIVAGPVQPVIFPVPWASGPEASFLLPVDELRAIIEAAGFQVQEWTDTTEAGTEWFRRMIANPGRLAHRMSERAKNLLRSFEEKRARVVRAIALRALSIRVP